MLLGELLGLLSILSAVMGLGLGIYFYSEGKINTMLIAMTVMVLIGMLLLTSSYYFYDRQDFCIEKGYEIHKNIEGDDAQCVRMINGTKKIYYYTEEEINEWIKMKGSQIKGGD